MYFAVLAIFIVSWYYLSRSSSGQRKPESHDDIGNTRECTDETSVAEGAAALTGTESVANGGKVSDKNLPPKAERGLQILHDCDEPNIDIVAVHGLGANPDYAWVWLPKNNPIDSRGHPDKPFNWLQKLLPAELSCRVLAFNYPSTWILNAPQQKLSNISDNLLRSLRDIRDKKPAVGRPLIFIGHSFGGNVIEQAIVSASRQDSEYSSIAQSTVGVVFLGTPHRGSPAASWGALIASLAPPRLVTEDRLLKDLEEQSDSQADRLRDFSRWLFSESVPAVCAFEQLVTDYSSRAGAVVKFMGSPKLVVPESSACIDGHHKISLHTDHLKINKFYGADDPSFKLVYPQILRMAEGADETLNRRRNPKKILTDESSTSGNLKKCLQKMRVKNPRDILSDIQTQKGEKVGNTCEWILKREEFSVWSASEEPQFLRLVGSPGIGKTMISTFLVEVLKMKVKKSPSKVFAYFFCDDKDQHRKTPTAILRSLIWQLLLQRNGLFRHVQPDFEKHTDERVFEDLFSDFSALWRMFQDMLKKCAGEVFILIDALDECESSTRQALFVSIKKLFQSSPAEGSGKVKLLITCRPDIEGQLQNSGTSLRVDSANINNDLTEYIDTKVNEMRDIGGHEYPLHLKETVRTALRSRAEGTFLWVSLMLAELGGVLMRHVEEKLKDLPQELDGIYVKILNRIPCKDRKTAKFILQCMVAARRPLKKAEIQTALATWETGSIRRGEDLAIYGDILSTCSSILHVSSGDDATLNFCHQSVKDFLLRKPSTIDAFYHTAEDVANRVIFEACWVYLSADEFRNGNLIVKREQGHPGMLVKAGPYKLRDQFSQHFFLEYASSEWENHAIASYSALLHDWQGLAIDVTKALTLRDSWLLRVAEEGQEAVVRLLLEKGAEIEAKDESGRTALGWAARQGHEAVVRLLLEKGAEIEAKESGRTALWWAARQGHEAVVRLLLEKGANCEAKDEYSQTALGLAANQGHEAVVRLLLEKGADCEAKDEYGRTALGLAANQGHEAIVRLLLKKGADCKAKDEFSQTALGLAANQGHEAVVRLLLKKGANCEAKDEFGQTALRLAADQGHEAVVRLLLEKGADCEAKDKSGQTALWWAAYHRHEAVVRLLLEKGADCEAKDEYGRTALWWAAYQGHEAVVRLLLEKGADCKAKDEYGQTALGWAVRQGHEAMVWLLLEKGADIEAKNEYGQTALGWAAEQGHEAVVRLLLEKGADIEAKDKS
ncbi:hypothetical protein MY1884_008914, partial [Beauveria asiatica]